MINNQNQLLAWLREDWPINAYVIRGLNYMGSDFEIKTTYCINGKPKEEIPEIADAESRPKTLKDAKAWLKKHVEAMASNDQRIRELPNDG